MKLTVKLTGFKFSCWALGAWAGGKNLGAGADL